MSRKPLATAATSAAAALLALLLAVVAAFPSPAAAHDWIGANGTPDCECLPHVKLDCASLAPVQKAWRTLVSRECNATVAAAGAAAAAGSKQRVEMLVDAKKNATAAAHAGHMMKEEDEEEDASTMLPPKVYMCQVDQPCYEAFHVVVAHHYGCPPDFLPLEIAEGIHGFQTPASPVEEDGTAAPDTICQGCFQPRYMKKGAGARPPLCPKLSCHHTEEQLLANLTAAADAGCARDCSSDECGLLYHTLRVHHDGCVLNDNPMPSRLAADRLRRACGRAHGECTFSNGTYAAGNYTVDCKRDKNAGPFRAPLADLAGEVELDHSGHDHGVASSAPANVPPAAAASAAGAEIAGLVVATVVAAAALLVA